MKTFVFTSPDGKDYEVSGPDDATEAQAFNILQSQLGSQPEPAPQRSTSDELKRQAGLTARYIAEGATALPGIVGNAANEAVNIGTRGVNSLLGTNIPRIAPVTDAISHGLTDLGLPTPEGRTERLVGDVSRGLAGGGAQIKVAQGLVNKLPQLASNVARSLTTNPMLQAQATVGASLGSGVAREEGTGLLGQIIAGLAGGIAAPGSIRGVQNAANSIRRPVDEKAANTIAGGLRASDLTPDEAAARMGQLGRQATLSDLSDNLQRTARNVYTQKGPGSEVARNALDTRSIAGPQRVVEDLKNITGKDTNFFESVQGVISKRKAESAPLYAEADKAIVPAQSVGDLHKSLLTKATEAEGTRLSGALKKFAGMLKTGEDFKTNVKQLDIVKRQARDMVTRAYRSGDTDTAKELDGMLKTLSNSNGTGILEKSSSAYRQANKIFSDDSSVLKALESGKKVLTADADEVADNIAKLSLAEKDAYIQGAVKGIRDQVLAGKKFSNDLVRERLRNAFPDEGSFKDFMFAVEREKTFAGTKNFVLGGSQTANKQADMSDALNTGYNAAMGNYLQVAMTAAKRFLTSNKIPERLHEPLARALTTPEGSKRAIAILQKQGIGKPSEFIQAYKASVVNSTPQLNQVSNGN